MSFNIVSIFVVAAVLLTGCQDNSLLQGNITVSFQETKPSISNVKIQNDQLIVSGSNLSKVTTAKIEGGTNHVFTIESKSDNKIVLNAKSALTFLVGQSLNLIISSANASATFPISFELQNGQVTAAKLHHMGASAGQFLRFNGTSWVPSAVTTNQVYVGTYDAGTDTPNLSSGVAAAGTYYIVTVAGTQDLGSGSTNYNVGDWVISDGTNWSKVAVGTNTVSNFNGRTGAVVPLSGDYSWSMLTKAAGKLTGSKLSEIADVDVTGIQDQDILQWNSGTSKWEVTSVPAPVITAGSISNTQIANSAIDSSKIVDGSIGNADISATAAIDQSKINNLTTDLSNKEPKITAGTAAQYWSGTKTWQNLNSAVLGSTLTGFSSTTGAVSAADSVLSAFNKLTGNIGVVAASQGNYVLKAGDTMSGALAMGGNKITGLGTPTAASDAATMAYVDSKVGAGSQWTTVGSDIHYSTGNVGIGTGSPAYLLDLRDTSSNGSKFHISAAGDTGLYMSANNSGGGTLSQGAASTGPTWVAKSTGSSIISFAPTGDLSFFATSGLTVGNTFTPFERMRINATGDVGIGTTTPNEKLTVAGNIAVTGAVRLKSDNLNYVELQAPNGLGSTLNFRLPASVGTSGQALITDGSGNLSWSTVSGGAPADGSIGYAKLNLADGDIPLAKLAGTSDATKYLKGDKSWGTFITDVLASTFATVTPSNTAIANGDSLLTVVNKTQGQINNLASNTLNKTGADTVTGTMTIDAATGALKIPTTPSGADLTDAANVQFVQNYVGTYGQWIKNVNDISYSAGKVGVGTTSPVGQLTIQNSILGTSSATASFTTPRQLLVNDAPTSSGGRHVSASILTQPSPTASGTAQYTSLMTDFIIPASSTFNMQQTRSIHALVANNGSGNITGQTGAIVAAMHNGPGLVGTQMGGSFTATSAAGTINNQYGVNAVSSHGTGTLLTSQWGSRGASAVTNGSVTFQYGVDANATISLTSSATQQFGVKSVASNATTSTLPDQWGTYSTAVNSDAGTVTQGKGVYGQAYNNSSGVITNAYGVHGEVWNNNAAGTITTGYALYGNVQNPGSGTITNGYGLYLGNIEATNKWSVYANDPTSPSYFAGSVGIGTNAPGSKLVVSENAPTAPVAFGGRQLHIIGADGANAGIQIDGHGTNAGTRPVISFRQARGTGAIPTPTMTNDVLGSFGWWGRSASGYSPTQRAELRVDATEDWTDTAQGTAMIFKTTQNGSITNNERMRIDNNGNVGIGTTAPQASLEVSSAGNSIINNSISDDTKYTAFRLFTLRGNSLETMGSSNPSLGNKGWEFGANGNSYPTVALRNVLTMNYWSGTAWITPMAILPTGDVGIGTTAPGYKLHVNGSVAGVGAYNALSDRRYKKDFEKIPDALERVVALNGFYYKWRQSEHPDLQFEKGRDMGVIAQEVQKLFPEAVSTDKKSGIMSVAYSKLIAPIIEAIKELFNQSQKHEREIASLKEENRLLKESLCEINPKAKICNVTKAKPDSGY
ncbi:tail fiber domain-containing protein [Peredibacter starrii]|uniref:Tail fiber domain-containing protein n=1 Tax=Peredibacter starrii TaxID=28202 RepID=A0AAX4HLE6_9BACT|nr:tail fiber domain-containing protein [Peredibacter starrii]WPU64041.1 tail fiber domain-containing protein [Peredibacter starrii]